MLQDGLMISSKTFPDIDVKLTAQQLPFLLLEDGDDHLPIQAPHLFKNSQNMITSANYEVQNQAT